MGRAGVLILFENIVIGFAACELDVDRGMAEFHELEVHDDPACPPVVSRF